MHTKYKYLYENEKFIEEKYDIGLIFGGSKNENIQWDNERFWKKFDSRRSIIVVINQTSTRSTEWSCHDKIVWFHTARTEKTPCSTIIQDQERPAYYKTKYENEVDIEIYGDTICANYSARIITKQEYFDLTDRKIDSKIKKKKTDNVVADYNVYSTWDEIPDKWRKNKNVHICEDNILRQNMTLKKKNNEQESVRIDDDLWKNYKHQEGFYMTNIRSSRTNFKKGGKTKPIWTKEMLLGELNEGINENTKYRINVFYEEGETNPDNYKFMVRFYVKTIKSPYDNKSMYNTNC